MDTAATDADLRSVASYVCSLAFQDIPEAVVKDCKVRIVDAIGCGIAGYGSVPGEIGRRMAARACVSGGARVLGTELRVLPEYAALANGFMVRYLDGNDTYLSGGGHPSDLIPAVLAVGDWLGRSGAEVLTAVVAAYEAYHWIFRATLVREKGWDHSFYTAVAASAGAAKLLRLGEAQTAHALAIAMTANHALLASRQGNLSMWKGCAAPYAARDGVLCALLAAEGIEGPGQPVRGKSGLAERFGTLEFPALGGKGQPFAVSQSHLKRFLCYYHAQTAIELALRMHGRLQGEAVASVKVFVYEVKGLVEQDPQKWRPKTRETADHSIPYIVAGVLLDGDFSDALFSDERLQDPRIHAMTDRLTMEVDPDFSMEPPEMSPCRIEVVTQGGARFAEAARFPKGHTMSPLSVDEVNDKFRTLAQRVFSADEAERVLTELWRLDAAAHLDPLMDALVIRSAGRNDQNGQQA
jgi:2-methylcitrate dehydratase